MTTIQVFPRSLAAGDSPAVVAILETDEHVLAGAVAVADLFRLESSEAVASGISDVEVTESTPGFLVLVATLSAEITASLSAGVYFLRFRVTFADDAIATVPPDDRLRLRVSA